jgi:hypothetical protein
MLPTIPHISIYTRKYVIIILANGITDIASDVPQLFMFTSIHDLDGDIWDDVGSEIAHLSPLILILIHKYRLTYYVGLGSGCHG